MESQEMSEGERVACWRLDQLIQAAKPLDDPLADVVKLAALAVTHADLHQVCNVLRAQGIVYACDFYLN